MAGESAALFAMDYSSSAYPLCGWEGVHSTDSFHTRTRIAGGGPSGRDAIEMELLTSWLPWAALGDGQNDWGWYGAVETTNPGYGASRFPRLYLYLDPSCNFECTDWSDGTNRDTWSNKLLINQNGADQRPIPHHGGDGAVDLGYFQVGLDGGDPQQESGYTYALGTWHAIQYQIRYSSGLNVADAVMRAWINTDTQGSPTLSVSGFVCNPVLSGDGSKYWNFGAFNNHGLRSGGIIKFRHAAFEIGDTFASDWNASK